MQNIYRPLPRGGQVQIRLLTILPADEPDNGIELSLIHDPSIKWYETLSYTWGRPHPSFPPEWDDPNNTHSITVNGYPFEVRPNLFSALKYIRETKSGQERWWIDAICINQNDLAEKNHQVRNMAYIYRKSGHTLIWLGPEDSTTKAAFEGMKTLSKYWIARSETLKMAQIQDEEDKKKYLKRAKVELKPKHMTQTIPALIKLSSRSWFERAWTVQEFFISANFQLQCGSHSCNWGDLTGSYHLLEQHRIHYKPPDPKSPDSIRQALIDMESGISQCYKDLDNAIPQVTQFHLKRGWKKRFYKERLLIPALMIIRTRKAANPRDKVFSALGLAHLDTPINVDYDMPVEQVYIGTTRRLIEECESFQILGNCQYPPKFPRVPTWTVDWSDVCRRDPLPQKGYFDFQFYIPEPLYHPCPNSTLSARFAQHGQSQALIVSALIMEPIVFTSTDINQVEPYSDDLVSPRLTALYRGQWLTEFIDFWSGQPDRSFDLVERGGPIDIFKPYDPSNEWIYTPSRESLYTAYLRTIVADVQWSVDSPYWRRTNREAEDYLEQSMAYNQELNIFTRTRVFAVSKSGFMIFAPVEAQIDDVIAIVKGSEHPWILRPTGSGFHFIGQAYVHGIMDGELWDGHWEDPPPNGYTETDFREIIII